MDNPHRPTEEEWRDIGRGPDRPRYRLVSPSGKTIAESDWPGTLIKLGRRIERQEGYKPTIETI